MKFEILIIITLTLPFILCASAEFEKEVHKDTETDEGNNGSFKKPQPPSSTVLQYMSGNGGMKNLSGSDVPLPPSETTDDDESYTEGNERLADEINHDSVENVETDLNEDMESKEDSESNDDSESKYDSESNEDSETREESESSEESESNEDSEKNDDSKNQDSAEDEGSQQKEDPVEEEDDD